VICPYPCFLFTRDGLCCLWGRSNNAVRSSPLTSRLVTVSWQVLLWSFCLFQCQCSVAWSGAAQAYYIRETVNLSSTTGQTVQIPVPSIDFRCLNLALKAETAWQQSFISLSSAPQYLSLLHCDSSSAQKYTIFSCARPSGESSDKGTSLFLL